MIVLSLTNARMDGTRAADACQPSLNFLETGMTFRRSKALAFGVTCSLFLFSVAQAQPASDQASTMDSSSTSKPAQKATKKAERKARREKKNAELKTLEKNGYNPSGNQLRYPQNVQHAERKANPGGAGVAVPASAP